MAVVEDDSLVLPPGFRFHPTDEEIITHYLFPKVLNHGFTARAMGEVDLNKCEPWDLPSRAKMGEKEWYFFFQRDRKYPTGTRTNRATESGYWKATGKDKEIYRGRGILVGMKKTLVFYMGRAPRGEKTNWVMNEFRLEGRNPLLIDLPKSTRLQDEWVVCKVFHKNTTVSGQQRSPLTPRLNSFADELINSPTLPPLMDATTYCHSADEDSFDFKAAMAMPSYSSMIAVDDMNMNNTNSPPLTNPYFWISPQQGYLHDGPRVLPLPSSPAYTGQCKAEQFSNQSMLSQDTGISTDHNAEISSVLAKHVTMPCEDFDGLPTSGTGGPNGVLDLRHMWRC